MIEDETRKFLVDGETPILIDKTNEGKLVLTSKRLFVYGSTSPFNRNSVLKMEVKLKDITSVHGYFGDSFLGAVGNSWLVISNKAGEELLCHFYFGSDELFLDNNTVQVMAMNKVSSWVNAINLELAKSTSKIEQK